MAERDARAMPERVHDAAGQWLARRQGEFPPDAEREFRAWLEADPAHRRAYDQAEQTWRDSFMLADSDVGRTRRLTRAPFLMRHRTHVAAAGLGLAAVFGLVTVGIVGGGGPFALVSPAEAAVYRTAVGEIRTIRLSDGSQVTLDTATVLRVTFTARGRRLALEQGRARFHVVPDAKRPLTVVVPGGEVAGRGTLFDVSVNETPARIAAIAGNIELRSTAADAGTGSQRVAAGQQSMLGAKAAPKPISSAEARWPSGMLALDSTPLGDAVAAINRYNDVQVRLADPDLGRMPVTGAFRVRDPQEFARAVAATFELSADRSHANAILLAPRRPQGSAPPQK